MTMTAEKSIVDADGADGLAELVRGAGWQATVEPLDDDDVARMRASAATIERHLSAQEPIYGLTQGFGPLVGYSADESETAQGTALISHLGSGQGRPLDPDVGRLVVLLRLQSMRRGYSAVAPAFWRVLAELWNAGFTPAIPRDGTVSASGDLQPLAHAALAFAGVGDAWVRDTGGQWVVCPAREALAALGAQPLVWPVREALAFVNGTGVGLAVSTVNHQSAMRLVRATATLSSRLATILRANPEHYDAGISIARGQVGQLTVAEWLRDELPTDLVRDHRRPLQEPYSLRCAPQVLGAVLDQLDHAGRLLAREAAGVTDNPITVGDRILHGGNFHAMPVGFASEQTGLAVHMAAYLAERQLNLLLSPVTNGGLPPMLTPRAGRGSGLAGVQISATSFISRIRQLVYPASLTTLPTNGWNQDHVPMTLNGANGVTDALELAWLAVGSLALGVAQLAVLADGDTPCTGVWAELAEISPPLEADRPLAAEVRAARDLLDRHAAELVAR